MTLFSYYKQREVLARNIEESEHRLKDIRRMKKEGIVTRNDEIRSELQLTNDRLAYQEADNSISIACLLYTSPSPRDRQKSRMPSSA